MSTSVAEVVAPQSTNPVAKMLIDQIVANLSVIDEANKVLLAETEQGSGVREIDKALKDYKGDNDELKKAVAKANKAREAAKKAQTDARNLYRTQVLGEEEQTESDEEVDVDEVKNTRKMVMEAVTLLKSFADSNSLEDEKAWANSLQIPQVGRQGSSAVGQKKPRAFVKVADKTHDSFGEAAKDLSDRLSTKDEKGKVTEAVEVTSGDLVLAWDEAGGEDGTTFDFRGVSVTVTKKETKKAAAAA